MKKYIDTHAHYGHKKFGKPTQQVLSAMSNHVEKIIQIGTNTKTNDEVMSLISDYDYVYGMVGYFPTDVWELSSDYCNTANDNIEKLVNRLKNEKIVGIGEIGLDYNWNRLANGIAGDEARIIQQEWFRRQLDFAREANLPVSVHSRDAEEDTLAIFDEYDEINGVIHCYSYGVETARRMMDKGFHLGIGGTSTYPSNKEIRRVIEMMPMDRVLLETDAPYLSPQAVRREVNTSANIQYVIENIAAIKGCSIDEVIEQTNKNAYKLFTKLRQN